MLILQTHQLPARALEILSLLYQRLQEPLQFTNISSLLWDHIHMIVE